MSTEEPKNGDMRVDRLAEDDCYRYDTMLFWDGSWHCAVPSCLHTSGPKWEAELAAFKARRGWV